MKFNRVVETTKLNNNRHHTIERLYFKANKIQDNCQRINMKPAIKRSKYNLRSQQIDPNTLNVRYWTRSRARPFGGIEQLHQPKEKNTVETRKRKCRGKMVHEFMDINAFCILKILGGLNLIELAIVADTSSNLRKLAHYHFQSKYCQPKYEVVDFEEIKELSAEITIPEAAKIFRNFGKYMRGLKINTLLFTDEEAETTSKLLILIKEYCTAMLQDLKLIYFDIGTADIRDFYSLIKGVEHLSLYHTLTDEPNKWTIKMPLCKSLEFDKMFVNYFLERRFPALEKISFRMTYPFNFIDPKILNFIHMHPNLRHISIVDMRMATIDVLQKIGENCLQLESFEFNGIQGMSTAAFLQAVKPFGAMKTLKSFSMNCCYNSVEGLLDDFVVNGVAIEHLHFNRAELNGKAISHLLKLKTIKTLAFQTMDSPNVDRLFWIASKMSSLCEFQIKSNESISCESLCSLLNGNPQMSTLKIDALEMHINLKTFIGLVKILKQRPKRIKLNFKFFNQRMKLNVPKKTVETNKQWIAIKEFGQEDEGLMLFYDFDTFNESEDEFDDDSFDDGDDLDLSFEAGI